MEKEMTNILCCPICKNDIMLHVTKEDNDNIITGDLYCQECGIHYPIENGVPNMLPPNIRDNSDTDIQIDIQVQRTVDQTKDRKLRVALISTPFFMVPPRGYSGLEQVVWDLACGLDELGHIVTIFGPEGSKSTDHGFVVHTGPSINTVDINWFEEEKKRYNVYKDIITPDKFDLVHDHTWFGFPYLLKQKYQNLKILHTHHGGLNWETTPPFPKPNLVAISKFMKNYTEQYFKQRGYNVCSEYVYNGINLDKYPYQQNKGGNLLFVGRLSTFKQPNIAVEIARKVNRKLDIVGGTFVDSIEYVNQLDKMVENDPNIKIYKDATHEFKIEKMQNSKALLFPSKMGEPFGLCLLPDSPILTLDIGVKKIKDIKVGDKVLTHKGRFMRVNNVIKRDYNGDMIKITSHKLRIPIMLTPEHRVLAVRTTPCINKSGDTREGNKNICKPGQCYYMKNGKKYKYCRFISGEEPYKMYTTEWIEARYLKKGDFVTYPIVQNEKNVDIEKIRVFDYIDDFLNITGDSYEDIGKQIDLFGNYIEKTVAMKNKGGTTKGISFEKSKVPAEILLTPDLMRLFGYYISEGESKAGRQLNFAFNINEAEYINDVQDLMKKIFGLETQDHYIEENCHSFKYSNIILSNMFQNMFYPKEYITKKGKGSKGNIVRIPPEFLNLSLDKLAELIKGEWRGDGTYLLDNKNNNNKIGYQMKTTSQTLAYQLQYILSKFGIFPSFRIDNSRFKHNENCFPQYLLEIFGIDAQIFRKIIEDEENITISQTVSRYLKGRHYFYTPIKNTDMIEYSGQVYNIEVEEDNSYVSSIVVHNCAAESMACGTPVIALNDGAVSEIVIHGKTGYICRDIDEMIEAVNKIHTISPEDCRKRAEELSRKNMAENYLRLYQRILNNDEW